MVCEMHCLLVCIGNVEITLLDGASTILEVQNGCFNEIQPYYTTTLMALATSLAVLLARALRFAVRALAV